MIFSVSEYLGILQETIAPLSGSVSGEIGQITIRGKAVYFTLRDMKDGSVLSCLIWLSTYSMLSLDLKEGTEVLVIGQPEIYKPMGRLTFKAQVIELVGEGELKKAYDKLKAKLEAEGVFAEARKKSLPAFPLKIGVITSREGAVIHDFLNNLGQYGFQTELVNSRVEGSRAVEEIISSIRTFKNRDIDVLVIIRGGGSLESFIAFNNEAVIREILDLPFPVIVGLGHDKDVPLLSFAADMMTSTPTAITALLNEPWMSASYEFSLLSNKIQNAFSRLVQQTEGAFEIYSKDFRRHAKEIIAETERQFQNFSVIFSAHDPVRQLNRGFSIVRSKGKVISKSKSLRKGDEIEVQFGDGKSEGVII